MSKDEELTKCLTQIEQYKEQINSMEMQSSYLQAIINEYNKVKLTLEHIIKIDKGSEVLLPLGGSTYIEANVNNPSKVLFDIGAGVVTEKTSIDAISKIDDRIQELQKTQEKLLSIIQNLQNEATEVSAKAQEYLSEQEKDK